MNAVEGVTEQRRICPVCGGRVDRGATLFTVDLKFGVFVVREVPALVCMQCGEATIENPIAAKLEAMVDKARYKRAVIEVTFWSDAVA